MERNLDEWRYNHHQILQLYQEDHQQPRRELPQTILFIYNGQSPLAQNPLTINIIHNTGHRYVFRAPYWPVDRAVEYVFNTVQT